MIENINILKDTIKHNDDYTKNAICNVSLGPGNITNLLSFFMDSNMSSKLTTVTGIVSSPKSAVTGKLSMDSTIFPVSSEIL